MSKEEVKDETLNKPETDDTSKATDGEVKDTPELTESAADSPSIKDRLKNQGKKSLKNKGKDILHNNKLTGGAYRTYEKTKNAVKNTKRTMAVGKFLFFTPAGWITLGVGATLVTGMAVSGALENQISELSYTQDGSGSGSGGSGVDSTGQLSDEEIAVISSGCDVNVSLMGDSSGTSVDADGNTVATNGNPFLEKIGGKTDVAQKIIAWGKKEGFSGGQIAVLLAVGARESGLQPDITNPAGGVRGIWQWSDSSVVGKDINGDRMKWLRDQNLDVNKLENQLKLAKHELSEVDYYSPVIETFAKHQTTSDEDLEAVLEVWETWFEGLKASDPQRKEDAVWGYIKGALEAFPELNKIKQAANFKANFNSSGSSDNNVSNSVSATVAEKCDIATDTIGGDALAQSIVQAAFNYYGKNIKYSQDTSLRGQLEWNSDKTDIVGGYLDCSSFVFNVLNDVGIEGIATIGNTDTLFSYEGTVFREISRDEVTTGDIFVSGIPGQSTGNGGHTGIFLNKNWVIHSTSIVWDNNGGGGDVWINDYPDNDFGLAEGHFYRIVDRTVPEKASKVRHSDTLIDITTNEKLAAAIKAGKIKDPRGVDAGQSDADAAGAAVPGSVNTKPNYAAATTYPVGQCTWGAKAMAPWAGDYWGNGGQWAASARREGFKTGTTPKPGALICWTPKNPLLGEYGHIGYVISVKSSTEIQVMEANYNGNQNIGNYRGWFNPLAQSTDTITYIYPK